MSIKVGLGGGGKNGAGGGWVRKWCMDSLGGQETLDI